MRAGNDGGWSGWRNSPASGPYTPPNANPPNGPVAGVSLTRADGAVTANWNAPNGATKYHVTYTTDNGKSWSLAALNHTSSAITISNADNAKTYVVGVRAGNAHGWSGWVNSAPIAPLNPPAAPASVTVTRADGTVTATWPAVSGAAKYHVTYSSDDKQNWSLAAFDHAGSSITISGADNAKTYVVGVRAGNADGWSGWTDSAPAGPYAPLPAAPANLAVTSGDGYLDVEWDAVSDATGYDVRAKTAGSSDWHDVTSNVTATSHRYTTDATIDHVAVRARNANGAGPWAERSRAPAHDWLTTVQQTGGASSAAAQAQSQLAAPTSVTVTRDNGWYDEKLHVTWTAVTGATGYNLVCSDTNGWGLWWSCGAVNSGTTTNFTVDEDTRGGRTGFDLDKFRPYLVAVRAVTSVPADASDWTNSANAYPALQPPPSWPGGPSFSFSRGDGSLHLWWLAPPYSQGYEIECATGAYGGTYTLCADVETATVTNGRVNATISSWTAGGTNYTIDNDTTYNLAVRITNAWGVSPYVRTWPILPPGPDRLGRYEQVRHHHPGRA